MHLKAVAVVLFAAYSYAAPHAATHAIHERRDYTPTSWVKRDRILPTTTIPVRVGLRQSNLEKGYDFLMDVSHPASTNYAKHWNAKEVADMFAPSDEAVATVREWLVDSGIPAERITHSDNKGWLAFDVSAQEVENLLHTEYYVYEHTSYGHIETACDQYQLPKHVQWHIDYITPGVKLAAPVKRGHSRRGNSKRGFGMTMGGGIPAPPKSRTPGQITLLNELEACDVAITPICVAALYEVPPTFGQADPSNSLGIFEEGDFYAQKDLNLFFANFTPYIPKGTHPIPAFIDGAEAPVPVKDAGGESDLDFQLAYPLIYPQTITLYQTDDLNYATNPNSTSLGGFNTFLDALDGSYCTYSAFGETGDDPVLDPTYPDPAPGGYKGQLQCGVYKPTNVISVSYGGQEFDLPAYYQERQCNEFMKLGLQGHSIFYASGDDGVAGPPGDDSPNGCLGKKDNIFSPAWPNSCPYLTNVGATKVYPNKTVFEPECAVVDPINEPYSVAFSSGGGFSNIYPIPGYQAAAVAKFFADYNPPYKYYSGNASFGKNGGVYNRIGRGYPDVAANGDNIAVYNEGSFTLEGGTSASTPIFASIVNRINEERLLIGKKPIGFINPAVYSHPEVLNDITCGSNPGCSTSGFESVPGWDPVTGLGTPNFPRMLALFLSLP
ncbi:hypothetical protein MMC26_005437 [Xylographa opegraphella]|nr:hypothetical protein [Xylographa opegraphella]